MAIFTFDTSHLLGRVRAVDTRRVDVQVNSDEDLAQIHRWGAIWSLEWEISGMGGPTVESLAGRMGQWWPGVALGNTDRGTAVSRGPSLTWLVRVVGDLQFGWWASWLQPAASGGEWHGPQPRQGGEELGFPRPALGQMQY